MKLNYHYSIIYDAMLTEMSNKEQDLKQIKEVQAFMKKLEKQWKRKEKKIISSIEKNSKLKFKEDINIYCVKHMQFSAISFPLTLKITKDIKKAEKELIHELIHNILMQNQNIIKPLIAKTYHEDDLSFKIHIPVLLIQKRVFKDIYPKKEINTFIKKDKDFLGPEWLEIERIEKKYKGNITTFLKNENLE